MRTFTWKLVVVCVACACVALSQTSRGTVTGTVLDASGAVITGARVTLTGVETGARLSTDSNQAGVYRFDAVDLGVYQLGVTHPGFRTYLGSGIGVEANRVTTVDYPSGTDPTFTWDAENRLTSWTDAVGSWTRDYDDCGRPSLCNGTIASQ